MFASNGFCDGVAAGAARERVAAAPAAEAGPAAPAGRRPEPVEATDFARRIEAELPFLRRAVRRWHREPANADDLVQDTIVQALANAHLWQPGSNLRAWLTTIMRNQFLAAVVRAKRSAELLEKIAGADPACSPDPREPRLLLRDTERALQRLPKIQRTVVTAVAIEGKLHEEVAQRLGMSAGAVRCHLARGRDRLRTAVRGDDCALPFARRSAASPPLPPPRPRPLPCLPVFEAAE
jgi:RNA polymerase sigma-70 factor (ECF subfamily)